MSRATSAADVRGAQRGRGLPWLLAQQPGSRDPCHDMCPAYRNPRRLDLLAVARPHHLRALCGSRHLYAAAGRAHPAHVFRVERAGPAQLCLRVGHRLSHDPCPFTAWLLKASFDTVPIEIEQAANIDGAQSDQILRRITLPIAAPALAMAALFAFLLAWDEFFYALLFTSDSAQRP